MISPDTRDTLLVMAVLFVAILLTALRAYGDGDEDAAETAAAIQTLQPAHGDVEALRLAKLFNLAGEENHLDPLLLVAIAKRESNLDEFAVGPEPRFEIGLMQTHGVALNFRPGYCTKALEGAECQIYTGAAFLAYSRDRCGGSTWRWLGSYGSSQCMTEEWARAHKSTKNARRFYDLIGGKQWP